MLLIHVIAWRRARVAIRGAESYIAIMSTYTLADAEIRLSELIDRALSGEGVVITRDDQSSVELKAMKPETKRPRPRPMTEADIERLKARRAGLPMPKTDAATLVRQMREEGEA
ncbi:MAG: type II toxin-antitoxin system Phd/YefM family antitoxin [Stellaceae bacterium]